MKKKLTSVIGIVLGLQVANSAMATDVAMVNPSVIRDLPATIKVSKDPEVFNQRLKDPQFACNIAKLFATGQGLKRDDAVAYKLFRYAAEHGNAEAQFQLGLFLADERGGINVADGPDLALYWLNKAMEHGHKGAKYSYNFLMNNTWYEGC
jgi:TPR repeat protein